MPRYHADDDLENEDEDDPEAPEDFDRDQDDGDEYAETIECPHCGHDVYESAEQCPHCRKYLSQEDAPRRLKPWWILIAVALALAAALTWLLH
jgi:hypothetical protein